MVEFEVGGSLASRGLVGAWYLPALLLGLVCSPQPLFQDVVALGAGQASPITGSGAQAQSA